jgi:hypothetical protein
MVWLNGLYGGKFPITISLGIISLVLTVSIVLSLIWPKGQPTEGSSTITPS